MSSGTLGTMQVGSQQHEVLVVSGPDGEERELAAAIEDTLDGTSVVAVTDPEDASGVLDGADVDGVVVDTDGSAEAGVTAVESLSAADPPVVARLPVAGNGTREAALDAGAEVVAPAGEGYRVLCNRLELVLSAAGARRTARETQQRYRRLLEASPAAIVIYDSEGTILYANPAAADLCGAGDPHGVVGRTVFEFVPDEDDVVTDRFRRVIEDREAVEPTELPIEGVDGERRHAETAGNPVTVDGEPGGQAVLADVTALKERERRLRTERDRFTALFESLPEPAVHVRYQGRQPTVETVNPAFEAVFGFDEAAAAGESLNDLVVPGGKQEEARAIDQETLAEGRIERELRRRTVDGTREFLFRAQTMETAEGGAEGVCIYVDITEQKQRQEALEHKNERLEAFASIVSHDLQSPLSVAKGNLFLAREEDDPEYLERVDGALDRMERIIEDLLKLARSGAEGVDPEPVDAGRLVTEAWSEIPGESATLENEVDAAIEADRGQLRELLTNLLRNAVEHGSRPPEGDVEEPTEGASGGRPPSDEGDDDGDDVTVRVDAIREAAGSDDAREPAHNAGAERSALTGFYVADDGPGIPEEERGSVFEPGYTTHDDGSGFGLVVVREIADAHGWDVSVTESAEGGARFEFRGVDPA